MKTIEFETAKKLKELGITPILKYQMTWYKIGETRVLSETFNQLNCNKGYILIGAALTLDEILDMLPVRIETNYAYYFVNLDKYPDKDKIISYCICYVRNNLLDDKSVLKEFTHANLAEAAGQLLIWCIENGHVKIEDINNDCTNVE